MGLRVIPGHRPQQGRWPRIIRAYGRRPWIEACFEGCKTTLHIEPFKFRSPGGIYGFIALRFLAFALFDYAGRRITHGRWSGGQIIRTLRYLAEK